MPRGSSPHCSSRPSNLSVLDAFSLAAFDSGQLDCAPRCSPSSQSPSSITPRSDDSKTLITATARDEDTFGEDSPVSFDESYRSSLLQDRLDISSNRISTAPFNIASPDVLNNQHSRSFSIQNAPRAYSEATGAARAIHSHPLYPRVGFGRFPKMGSNSGIRETECPLGEFNVPQYPYAMYPQNVIEERIDFADTLAGFPGQDALEQRPAGHRDDDLSDVAWPDGNTQMLPPYSYNSCCAAPRLPAAETTVDSNGLVVEHPINPALGEPEVLWTAPNNDCNGSGEGLAKGVMANWVNSMKRKQRECHRVPLWTLILIGVVIIVGGCIGGVIGGVLGANGTTGAGKKAANHTTAPHTLTSTAAPQTQVTLAGHIPEPLPGS